MILEMSPRRSSELQIVVRRTVFVVLVLAAVSAVPTVADEAGTTPADASRFQPLDVFELEWASDPRISPDGSQIVYVRNYMDVRTDRRRSDLWTVSTDGSHHRPLTHGGSARSPRWSPDGTRILYLSAEDGSPQLWVHWMDTGRDAPITRLTESPSALAWSPDGRWIALALPVPVRAEPFAEMPPKPEGAEWAPPPKVIDKVIYRADGVGYLPDAFTHLFVVPAEGGTPRQLTSGDYQHGGSPSWTPDGRYLVLSANREEDWELDVRDTEVYELEVASGEIRPLTDRQGPDNSPVVSPDGSKIAYLGFDDREQGYQVTQLYVMNRDGADPRPLTGDLDRSVSDPVWAQDGTAVYVRYADEGVGKVARVGLDRAVEVLATGVDGLSLGRPYGGGEFSVSDGGRVAFTLGEPDHPADVAVTTPRGGTERLTRLNRDLLERKELGEVEEIWYRSSYDGRRIQGWIVKPPGFDPEEKYPLILEIHGGPFADYGPRFGAEIQLYAAAGYVVLYTNPRGSTGYGEEFGNLIHHAYPGHDYDDLMSGVDAVLAKGYVDPDQLFVTGGSGGGVLSAWIVGNTDRFAAAAVAKPVINWLSFVGTADFYAFFSKDYWFPGPPWENPMHYWERSPLSKVGNVTTPTMLLTGEADYRTPIEESEQFYQALKLRGVDTVLVRIPGASHHIAERPSQLVAKVQYILAWFERYRKPAVRF
jgi:dipeptidyl aminopeptidase/acylaminoacyl peptidase